MEGTLLSLCERCGLGFEPGNEHDFLSGAGVNELSRNCDREAIYLLRRARIRSGNGSAAANLVALALAHSIAQRLGITNLTDDAYDVPTYMRRQQDREV